MNRKLFLFAIIIFILLRYNSIILCDDECGKPINCTNKKYPYKQCWQGNIIVCTENPTNAEPQLGYLRDDDMWPLCLEYDKTNGPGVVKMLEKEPWAGEPTIVDVFYDDEQTIQASIDCALYQWHCLCNKQNDECKCRVKLKWVNKARELQKLNLDPKKTLAVAYQVTSAYDENDCWLNCEQSYILLNNTPEFHDELKFDSRTYYKQFFYNKGDDIPGKIHLDKHSVINFCDVLGHEIGHLFGIPDYNRTTCPPGPGLMEGFVGTGQWLDYNQPKKGLSENDKCTFMKLMCPIFVEVEIKNFASRGSHSFPNPATNNFTLEFSWEKNENLTIELFDIYGIKINGFTYLCISGINSTSFDVKELPSGIYFVKIAGKERLVVNQISFVK